MSPQEEAEVKKGIEALILVIIESNKLLLETEYKDEYRLDKKDMLMKAYKKVYEQMLEPESWPLVQMLVGDIGESN